MAPLPVVDEHSFDELQARLGADFARELVSTFDEEAPRLVGELRAAAAAAAAAAADSAERFRRAAHTLKGDSRTFGAPRLAAALLHLEQVGMHDGAALQALAGEVENLQAALRVLAAR